MCYVPRIVGYAPTTPTSQLHCAVTCSGGDATSSQWRVDSVGIPERIDVWRNAVGMARPPSASRLAAGQPLGLVTSSRIRRQWAPPTSISSLGASAINASAINVSYGQKCIACDEWCGAASPGCSVPGIPAWVDYERERDLETALFRCSQCNPVVMCISSPLFFFLLVMHLPRRPPVRTRPERRVHIRLLQAHRDELRTLNRRPNSNPLATPLLLFYSSYPFYSVAVPIFRPFLFLFLLHLLLLLPACLVFERTYERQKAFHRGTPNRSSY